MTLNKSAKSSRDQSSGPPKHCGEQRLPYMTIPEAATVCSNGKQNFCIIPHKVVVMNTAFRKAFVKVSYRQRV